MIPRAIISCMIALLLAATILLFSLNVIAQSPTSPTPSPIANWLLRGDDTCALPCWFGLTPGESTSDDVTAFFETYDNLFYSVQTHHESTFELATNNMISGVYFFFWEDRLFERTDIVLAQNQIYLKQGIIRKISIDTPQHMSLDVVLNEVGEPDVVIAGGVGGHNPYLFFYYVDVPLLIVLISNWDVCSITDLEESFWIDEVNYYSPDHRFDLRPGAPENWDRLVPEETWQSWNSEKIDIECQEAWRELPT